MARPRPRHSLLSQDSVKDRNLSLLSPRRRRRHRGTQWAPLGEGPSLMYRTLRDHDMLLSGFLHRDLRNNLRLLLLRLHRHLQCIPLAPMLRFIFLKASEKSHNGAKLPGHFLLLPCSPLNYRLLSNMYTPARHPYISSPFGFITLPFHHHDAFTPRSPRRQTIGCMHVPCFPRYPAKPVFLTTRRDAFTPLVPFFFFEIRSSPEKPVPLGPRHKDQDANTPTHPLSCLLSFSLPSICTISLVCFSWYYTDPFLLFAFTNTSTLPLTD
jgi:hypothetical protein